MGALKTFQVTTRVLGRVGYHLTYGSVTRPSVTRDFIRTMANTIADFPQPKSNLSLPEASPEELFPVISTLEIPFRMSRYTNNELPPLECLYLAGIVRAANPSTVFEIGTHKGRTAKLFAEHTAAAATIYTLDLPPTEMAHRQRHDQVERGTIGQEFLSSSVASKIVQLYGDSRTFEYRPFEGQIALAFIDGDHSYETVTEDTAHVLRLMKPGGVIIWDDYHPAWPGVIRCVEELARTRPICHLHGTRLACYQFSATT